VFNPEEDWVFGAIEDIEKSTKSFSFLCEYAFVLAEAFYVSAGLSSISSLLKMVSQRGQLRKLRAALLVFSTLHFISNRPVFKMKVIL
jgi:hypothetical protein